MAGETTSVSAASVRQQRFQPGGAIYPIRFDLSYSTSQNELNDVMEAGYLPAGVKVLAVGAHATDMDSGIAAVVHKVTVGSVDIVSSLTAAQASAAQLVPVTAAYLQAAPSASEQLVKVTTTTAAATAVAGTLSLVLWCYNEKLTPS
jgi:hypothetical protein